MSDISDAIEAEAITGVKSATVDGQTVTGRDLRESIEADQYIAGKDAASNRRLGVSFFNTRPPGAT